MTKLLQKLSLMCLALVASMAMYAGENDLLWSYDADHPIPSTSPDNGLYYGGYVNDASGTNLGLHGVKLNGSGYAYFAKAAVAGTLKLTFSNRKATTAYEVSVYKCTITDGTATKGDLIADLSITEGPGSASVDIAADVEGIYITRKTSSEGVLSKIEFTEKIARTFTDFKVNFSKDWASTSTIDQKTTYYVTATEDGVPTFSSTATENYLCTFKGRYHSAGYGITSTPVFTVPVDGTVKFYYGMNDYGDDVTVTNQAGETVATFNTKGDKFSQDPANVKSYLYTGKADVLTFTGGGYVPYFAAEATEVKEATITYKDQNGNTLGTKNCYEGDAVGEIPDTIIAKIQVPDGSKLRGWVYASKVKAVATDIVDGSKSISASVTPVETATVGSIQTYNMQSNIFYPEDHETFSTTGKFHNAQHGFSFAAGGNFSVNVAGKAQIILTECTYSAEGTITVTDAEGNTIADNIPAKVETDGTTYALRYTGDATTLTFTFSAGTAYLHKVVVYNVQGFIEKDAAGYYEIPAGDQASLVLALVSAQEGDKIYVPDGTYDLAQTVLTPISAKNVSLIGQSMEGTIIKNAPAAENESINNTATLLITGNNCYLQDITLQNALDYYKADNGRAVCLWDKADSTVCKNVKMLSYQDTYYSNKIGAKRYFEGGEIHGTVDYICGDGSVWFEGVDLVCEQRAKAGGGADAVTASNADASDKGYVFNNCKLQYAAGITGTLPVVSLGRSWNNAPQCVFLNTTVDNTNGEMVFTGSGISRWTLAGMNVLPTLFGEYNTKNEKGEVISPESNNITFTYKTDSKDMNTILAAETAATYTMAGILGDWAAKAQADAQQVTSMQTEGVFLLEDGTITTTVPTSGKVRVANARGGFGPVINISGTAINNIDANTSTNSAQAAKGKYIQNGSVVLVKDGKKFNVAGQEVK